MDVIMILGTFTRKTIIIQLDPKLIHWGQPRKFWFVALWRDILIMQS